MSLNVSRGKKFEWSRIPGYWHNQTRNKICRLTEKNKNVDWKKDLSVEEIWRRHNVRKPSREDVTGWARNTHGGARSRGEEKVVFNDAVNF